VAAAAIALMLQPDASQLSAFALAMLVILAASRSHLLLRVALLVGLLFCAAVAWHTPDPLAPVRYVEGVFTLAAEVSPFALPAALVCAALPVIALIWVAWATRSCGVLAVAAYYASLLALAPLQVTPVPLLGFGAGPILGYYLVAAAISRQGRPSSLTTDQALCKPRRMGRGVDAAARQAGQTGSPQRRRPHGGRGARSLSAAR
jgi:hypothetical protein